MGYGEPNFKMETVMATQVEYTVVANALVKEANDALDRLVATLPEFAQNMVRQYVTAAKVNAACGEASKTAVDTLDAFRAEKQAHAASYHANILRT
jgi:hypothetical protein